MTSHCRSKIESI